MHVSRVELVCFRLESQLPMLESKLKRLSWTRNISVRKGVLECEVQSSLQYDGFSDSELAKRQVKVELVVGSKAQSRWISPVAVAGKFIHDLSIPCPLHMNPWTCCLAPQAAGELAGMQDLCVIIHHRKDDLESLRFDLNMSRAPQSSCSLLAVSLQPPAFCK